MTAQKMSAQEIIAFIGNAEKKTNVKVTFEGELATAVPASVTKLGNVLFGDWKDIEPLLANLTENKDYVVEQDGRNSAVPLLDKRHLNARIEPGAIIRDQVTIEDNAVVMMGAVINIGAEIGAGTMIDMGAILGGRATVGKNSHIGAGAVLAGVIEPASADPVRIGDNVLVGANAVVIEVFKLVTVQSLLLELSLLKMFLKMWLWLVFQLVSSRKLMRKHNKKQHSKMLCVTCNILIVEACKASISRFSIK